MGIELSDIGGVKGVMGCWTEDGELSDISGMRTSWDFKAKRKGREGMRRERKRNRKTPP